jgi:hypothetical protein
MLHRIGARWKPAQKPVATPEEGVQHENMARKRRRLPPSMIAGQRKVINFPRFPLEKGIRPIPAQQTSWARLNLLLKGGRDSCRSQGGGAKGTIHE